MTENQIKSKKFFNHVANLPQLIESKELELQAMEAKAIGLGAIRYDKERVQTSPKETMSEAVIRMAEFCEKLKRDYLRMIADQKKADEILEKLPDDQHIAIRQYLFEDKTFYEISKKIHVSPRTVKRRYYDGLENAGKYI